jgi:hypothetical protein
MVGAVGFELIRASEPEGEIPSVARDLGLIGCLGSMVGATGFEPVTSTV